MDDPKLIAQQAETIVGAYLQPGSNTEVYLSDELRQSITDIVNGDAGKKNTNLTYF